VCGGKNIAEQQYVAVALPGARVKWHGQGDLVEITVNKVRGVESMGMICAAEEIGLFDAFPSHGEKDILDLGIWFPEEETPAGRDLADLLGVKHDTVMDVEVTTNRPDAMGMVGLAREISVVMNTDLIWKPTDMVALLKKRSVEKPDRLIIDIKTPHVKRYQAVFIRGVKNGHSPCWLKSHLPH
jgi:phenylalanyl-tRNA synthetase beta chain